MWSQEFYELMQTYRHAPLITPSKVLAAFEAIKAWLLRTQPVAQTEER